MEDVMKHNFPSIMRLLNIYTIGPYLIKYGILEMDEYYNEYLSSVMPQSRLIPKLILKLQKHPQEFMMALEECAKDEPHSSHLNLLAKLQDQMNNSQKVRAS